VGQDPRPFKIRSNTKAAARVDRELGKFALTRRIHAITRPARHRVDRDSLGPASPRTGTSRSRPCPGGKAHRSGSRTPGGAGSEDLGQNRVPVGPRDEERPSGIARIHCRVRLDQRDRSEPLEAADDSGRDREANAKWVADDDERIAWLECGRITPAQRASAGPVEPWDKQEGQIRWHIALHHLA